MTALKQISDVWWSDDRYGDMAIRDESGLRVTSKQILAAKIKADNLYAVLQEITTRHADVLIDITKYLRVLDGCDRLDIIADGYGEDGETLE